MKPIILTEEVIFSLIKKYGEIQRDHLRASVRRGMAVQASRGFLVGPPKPGYRAERTAGGTIALLDRVAAPMLREAFEQALAGTQLGTVTRWLWEHGLRGKKGGRVGAAAVARILKDPFYAGYVRFGGELYEGRHEVLVSPKVFRRVQEKLGEQAASLPALAKPEERVIVAGDFRGNNV